MNQIQTELVINLFTLSLQQLLYRWKVYPEQCFEIRTAVGIQLHSLKESILTDYITQIKNQFKAMIDILSGIEILILQEDEILQRLVIRFEVNKKQNTDQELSVFDKDIQLKTVMHQLLTRLCKVKPKENDKTFKIRFISNGAENQQQEIQEQLLTNWVIVKSEDKVQNELVSSINLPNLDILVGLE
ncbi:hypothetical protein pb186bvf_016618 [Paramecium bursaria]